MQEPGRQNCDVLGSQPCCSLRFDTKAFQTPRLPSATTGKLINYLGQRLVVNATGTAEFVVQGLVGSFVVQRVLHGLA